MFGPVVFLALLAAVPRLHTVGALMILALDFLATGRTHFEDSSRITVNFMPTPVLFLALLAAVIRHRTATATL